MDTNAALLNLTPQWEIIPGYCLESRLGVGGYGEVWSVVDPQGGKKAVKVFHGQIDDERDARELRGLHRALDLDHPSVLRIERIETVRGHVVALMDLAEGTLRDRFDHFRARGEPGIPRDELLGYMGEIADALDYLFEAALLAHLDIKPENLLLVGGRVRIGDFGLVKRLDDSNISHVGGMTPRYTAPEVFKGRPTRHSDQYSLAIVYQEMLTGRLPFSGTTMAALASQHLSATPQLDALAPLERFAVGKALSKNPEHRFSDCRRFVERLKHRSSATLITAADQGKSKAGRGEGSEEEVRHDGHTIAVAVPKVTSLPRLKMHAGVQMRRPTIVIGVGGLGGAVLKKLRQLLVDRVGAPEQTPAIQLRYIDTDPDAIQEGLRGSGDATLAESEVVLAPLRHSQHYRDSIVSSLESISRRWFYNVPRTLRTSGMRALGRLAFLDNFATIRDAIHKAICTAVDPVSVQRTAANTNWPMAECDPRVLVVGSISGGTGGGMFVDLGYTIRQVLAEVGLADDDVSALLAYGETRGTANGLAQANAFAGLRELRYFGQPGCDYPGELQCGMAGFRDSGPTYGSTYLITESEGDEHRGSEAITDEMALYLYLSAATASGTALDECRRMGREEQRSEGVVLRTAGVCALTDPSTDDPGPYAEALCRRLVRKWKVGLAAALHEELVVLTDIEQSQEPAAVPEADFLKSLEHEWQRRQIHAASMLAHVDRAVADVIGDDRSAFWKKIIDDAEDGSAAASPKNAERAMKRLETFMGTVHGPGESESCLFAHKNQLADSLTAASSSRGAQLGADIAEWIISLVDHQDSRVHGALQAAQFFGRRIHAELEAINDRLAAIQGNVDASRQTVLSQPTSSGWLRRSGTTGYQAALAVHAELLCELIRYQAAIKGLNALESRVNATADSVREHWKSLTQFANRFRSLPKHLERAPTANGTKNEDRVASCYNAHGTELVERLDSFCTTNLFTDERRLSKVLACAGAVDVLADDLLVAARRAILKACRDTDNEFLARIAGSDSQQQLNSMVRQSLGGATPDLLRVGGAKRLLVMAPRTQCHEQLCHTIESISGDQATLCSEDNETVILCYEGEDIAWDGVESMLIRQRHDCVEMAERLHTRINIDWGARPANRELVAAAH